MAGAVGRRASAAGPRARRRLLAAVAAAALALSGCGGGADAGGGDGDRSAETPAAPWLDPDGESPLVGSLGVNPKDRSLWMATNTGLFRVAEGARRPEKVRGTLTTPDTSGPISEQLVIRFTGPDELLASGHPPPGDSALPPALGLIRSTDAGRSWRPVSELGTADFHAIEFSGGLLVGSKYGQSQILVSRDGGRTWQTRASPGVLVDLEVDPADPARWVASSSDGLHRTEDEGRTWRPVDSIPNSYLAWAADGTLYRLDPGGALTTSTDGGTRWEDRGSSGGEPRGVVADGPERLYALLLDGTVKRSGDGGRTWSDLVTPPQGGAAR